MSDSQDESGVDLHRVAVDPAAYDDSPVALYVYRQSRGDASYTGVVCDVAVQAVADGRVRGHEAVHQLRVDALVWHHSRTSSPPALVMLLHRAGPEFTRAVAEAQQTEPVLDFAGPQDFQQAVWRLGEGPATTALAGELAAADLYIADGHHRAAAALEEWRVKGKPPEAGLFCVVHPMDGLSLSAFHRRVSGPIDPGRLLALLGGEFEVREVAAMPEQSIGSMGLYVGSRWYAVRLPAQRPGGVAGLDASILQSRVLDRLDPAPPGRVRTVDTVPAAAPLDEIVSRCDVDRGALITLAPPPPEALTEVADAGEVMPAKTTYFEPKPAAGIFLHR
jgi:uncharacterized protein (DUF1015 family)